MNTKIYPLTKKGGRPPHPYFRFCKDCGDRFQPKGRYQKFCFKCLNKPEHHGGDPRYKGDKRR